MAKIGHNGIISGTFEFSDNTKKSGLLRSIRHFNNMPIQRLGNADICNAHQSPVIWRNPVRLYRNEVGMGTTVNSTIVFFILAGGMVTAGQTTAQGYPTKPIRLVVPFPPGGGTDIVSRTLQPALTTLLGQQILVDNRGGAQGITGIGIAAKANPDGYTMVIAEAGASAIAPAIQENLGFDVSKDLVAITTLAEQPYIMTVHPSVLARSLTDFIKLAHAKPGGLNYGSGSITQHIAQVIFFDIAKIKLTHIPYRGTGPAVTALVAGEVQTSFAGLGAIVSQIKAGRIRALAVTTPARTHALPEVATLDEQGFKGFSVRGWYVMLAPSGTPQPIITQLHRAFNDILSGGTTAKQLSDRGYEPMPMSLADSAKFVRTEIQRWGQAVKTAGIKAID